VFDYQKSMVKLEAVARMKKMSIKFAFERTMRDVLRRITMNSKVNDAVVAYSKRNAILVGDYERTKAELQSVQKQTGKSTRELERLRHEIELHQEWKAVQMADMQNLERKAKKHDLLKGIDFIKFEAEIKRQAKEEREAGRRRLNAPRLTLASEKLNQKKVAAMELALRQEEKLIRTIRANIEVAKLGAKGAKGQEVPATPAQADWEAQAQRVEETYELHKRRNEELRMAMVPSGTSHAKTTTSAALPLHRQRPLTSAQSSTHQGPPPSRPQPMTSPSIPTSGINVKIFHGHPMPPGLATFMQRGTRQQLDEGDRPRSTWGSNSARSNNF
jgi:hypothetical protein